MLIITHTIILSFRAPQVCKRLFLHRREALCEVTRVGASRTPGAPSRPSAAPPVPPPHAASRPPHQPGELMHLKDVFVPHAHVLPHAQPRTSIFPTRQVSGKGLGLPQRVLSLCLPSFLAWKSLGTNSEELSVYPEHHLLRLSQRKALLFRMPRSETCWRSPAVARVLYPAPAPGREEGQAPGPPSHSPVRAAGTR